MLDGPPTPYFPSPHLINQFCNFHPAKVVSLNDPEMRGRAQVECPGLMGEGQSHWTCWVEMGGYCVGSADTKDGDEGDWWPLQVGQCVLVGFVCGEPDALWMIPGPAPADEAEPLLPSEPKSYNNGRKSSKCRIRKSEAGHSLLMDDNGKAELLALLTWTGAGFAAHEPGKEEDDADGGEQGSKPRKGPRRGTKSVWAGDAGKPSELLDGGKGFYGWNDLQGNGIYTLADDKNGGTAAFVAYKKDGTVGASLILDGEGELGILTGGKTQIQVRGKQSRVYATCQMIWEIPFVKVSSYWDAIKEKIGKRFKGYSE